MHLALLLLIGAVVLVLAWPAPAPRVVIHTPEGKTVYPAGAEPPGLPLALTASSFEPGLVVKGGFVYAQ